MPLVQNIDGIPAYTTVEEALAWGSQFGISSYHTHIMNGQTIYMAGATHDEVTSAMRSSAPPASSPNINNTNTSSSSSGGY
tara:strand:- start:1722 stop:1964 length:243 start_codon:yes stop_codon:yes gene_type:complete